MLKQVVGEYTYAVFSLPWLVARDEGLFREQGLDVRMVEAGKVCQPDQPLTELTDVDPILGHGVFDDRVIQTYAGCHWGNVRRAVESRRGAKVVGKLASVAAQAIIVLGDSPVQFPSDLGDRPIGVTFHAGSHYMTLQMLEGFLPRDQINPIHVGSARYEALQRREVEAVTVMEPWISLAEKQGCRVIMQSHYISSDVAADELDDETWAAINTAIKKAVRLINADKSKYLHYFIAEVPPHLGSLTPNDFHLPRLRYIDPAPYTEQDFRQTKDWMASWGLMEASATFEQVVDNRVMAS
jgi:NitT/TauT family transport system substrate-binding protein